MIGGLGGFVLPIAFGVLNDLTGIWTSCFMLLFLLVGVALIWMHLAIRRMEHRAAERELGQLPELPEMQEIHGPGQVGALGPTGSAGRVPHDVPDGVPAQSLSQ